MNREKFLTLWDHMRSLHGITLQLVEALPADKLDTRVIPKMRTPKELVFHMCGQQLRDVSVGLTTGTIVQADDSAVASIKTREDLIRFVNDCWSTADRAIQGITDAQLAAMVKTPWGYDMPGSMGWTVIHDEYLHHRGQLFAYVRVLGQDVPHMWKTERNAPLYRPKAAAVA